VAILRNYRVLTLVSYCQVSNRPKELKTTNIDRFSSQVRSAPNQVDPPSSYLGAEMQTDISRREVCLSRFAIAALLVALAAPLVAQQSVTPPIQVFLSAASLEGDAAGGFISAPDARTERKLKMMEEIIRKHKGTMKGGVMAIATDRASADVVWIFEEDQDRALTPPDPSLSPLARAVIPTSMTTVTATLLIGEHRKPLQSKGPNPEYALKVMAADIEKFVAANVANIRNQAMQNRSSK
jgi:hypothetical protein